MVVEMRLVGVRVELPTNNPIVLLREADGEHRVLPIFIGAVEATAIAFALQGVVTQRPMTHDLMRDLLGELKVNVERIVITDLRDGTFFAEIEMTANGTQPQRLEPPVRRHRPRRPPGDADLRQRGGARGGRRHGQRRRRGGGGGRAVPGVPRGGEPGGLRFVGVFRSSPCAWVAPPPAGACPSGGPPERVPPPSGAPPVRAPPYGPPGRLASLAAHPALRALLGRGGTPGTVVAGWAWKTYAEGHIGVTTCL